MTLTSRKAQFGRRRPVENLSLVDVDQLFLFIRSSHFGLMGYTHTHTLCNQPVENLSRPLEKLCLVDVDHEKLSLVDVSHEKLSLVNVNH